MQRWFFHLDPTRRHFLQYFRNSSSPSCLMSERKIFDFLKLRGMKSHFITENSVFFGVLVDVIDFDTISDCSGPAKTSTRRWGWPLTYNSLSWILADFAEFYNWSMAAEKYKTCAPCRAQVISGGSVLCPFIYTAFLLCSVYSVLRPAGIRYNKLRKLKK